ncbi:MAG TPA: ABC transporter permease subunit [Coriobacteriia bacterium]|nr:ABC transporter permease subunit [Coriobacteriia bacterium]
MKPNANELSERSPISSAVWESASWVATAIVVLGCAVIVGFLLKEGLGSINWRFLSTDPNVSILEAGKSGIRVPMAGTLLLIVLSMAFAVPLAVASATYLAEYMDESRPLTRIVRVGLEVLASVPSVVFGMFGIAMFSKHALAFLSSQGAIGADAAFGRSFLVASIVMGVHVLPFMVKAMEEAVRVVPKAFRDAAAGLGITKWRALRRVVLPAAAPGLATAVILGMGLVAGDTAIVWMTLGGTVTMGADKWWLPTNALAVLKGTGSTLTTFTYFTSPVGEGTAPELAFGAALVLMLIILGLNIVAVLVGAYGAKHRKS